MTPEEACPPDLMRYITAASVTKLANRLHLAQSTQDWDLMVADHSRLDDFLSAYEDVEFDDDDRFAIMNVIVASLDDAVGCRSDIDELWRRAATFLRRDGRLHAATLSYWAQGDDPDPDHQFAITPRIREVWREVSAELPQGRGESE